MNSNKTFITLGIVVAILALGIAYAAIANQTVVVNTTATTVADDANFNVDITAANVTANPAHGNATTSVATDKNSATFTITGLTTKDDTATATFTISNTSTANVKATVSQATVASGDTTWFTVTDEFPESIVLEKGESETLTLTVKLNETPVTDEPAISVTTTITAVPSEGSTQS